MVIYYGKIRKKSPNKQIKVLGMSFLTYPVFDPTDSWRSSFYRWVEPVNVLYFGAKKNPPKEGPNSNQTRGHSGSR